MNVQDLINELQKLPSDLPVRAANQNGHINCDIVNVSSCVYPALPEINAVELGFEYDTEVELDKNGFDPMDL